MEQPEIIIERRLYDPSDLNPSTVWNNNNLDKDPTDPEYQDIKNLDRITEVKRTWLDKYIDLISDRISYRFELTDKELQVMQDASRIGRLTRNRTELFAEELEEIEQRVAKEIPFSSGEMYFIRTDAASPKDGLPDMPATSAWDVVSCLSTSHRAYMAFMDGCRTIYFMNWDPTMSTSLEMRVFIHHKRVHAISQYHSEKICIFNSYSDSELKRLGKRIVAFCEELTAKLAVESMVVDIGIQPNLDSKDPPVRFIELNSFGYWLSSGAGCFNWTGDRDKLYGRLGEKVFFRIVSGIKEL